MGHFTRHSRAFALAFCLLSLPLLDSCVSRQATTPGVPASPVPNSVYTLQQGLAILADTNLAATKTIIELNKQGVLKEDLTREILKYNSLVAQSARSGTIILQSNKTNTEKALAIKALMGQLPLPASIKSFMDAPGTSDLVVGVIGALTSIQTTISLITSNIGGLR